MLHGGKKKNKNNNCIFNTHIIYGVETVKCKLEKKDVEVQAVRLRRKLSGRTRVRVIICFKSTCTRLYGIRVTQRCRWLWRIIYVGPQCGRTSRKIIFPSLGFRVNIMCLYAKQFFSGRKVARCSINKRYRSLRAARSATIFRSAYNYSAWRPMCTYKFAYFARGHRFGLLRINILIHEILREFLERFQFNPPAQLVT